jgi:hypothetical protein
MLKLAIRPIRPIRPIIVSTFVVIVGCGPGGFASDGSSFGDAGTGTADDEIGDVTTSMSEPNPSTDSGPETETGDTFETGTETETETGADDWTDPETGEDTDDPEPIDADCTRVWTALDSSESHGHIGATPIGSGPSGAFVSVNPVIASIDAVNIDARIRSWSPSGDVIWERQLSWGDHRDDPLALLSDELGDVFTSGRINANTFEDAMVAKLDGQTGEIVWTVLRGEAGGYSSIAHNGAALVLAGAIGDFGDRWLEIVALEPDTGEILWMSEPAFAGDIAVRGLVVADGNVDVLVRGTNGFNALDVFRYSPPSPEPTKLVSLPTDGGPVVPYDLERLGDDRLAALYSAGPDSYLTIIDRSTGEVLSEWKIDQFDSAATIASELVELPAGQGLAVAGTIELGTQDSQTFVLRLDPMINLVCLGTLSKADLGVSRPPLLRGLVVGDDGALYTGSFVDNPVRLGAFARWE